MKIDLGISTLLHCSQSTASKHWRLCSFPSKSNYYLL